MLPSVCSWECHGWKAADTCFSENLVDYYFWRYSARAVVFTNLVELALLHEISQFTAVEKQQLQPSATEPPLFFWATYSEHRGSGQGGRNLRTRVGEILLVLGSMVKGSGCGDLRGDSQSAGALIMAKTPRSTLPRTGTSAVRTLRGTAGTSSSPGSDGAPGAAVSSSTQHPPPKTASPPLAPVHLLGSTSPARRGGFPPGTDLAPDSHAELKGLN